jgi:hypothetical protein
MSDYLPMKAEFSALIIWQRKIPPPPCKDLSNKVEIFYPALLVHFAPINISRFVRLLQINLTKNTKGAIDGHFCPVIFPLRDERLVQFWTSHAFIDLDKPVFGFSQPLQGSVKRQNFYHAPCVDT